MTLSIPSQRQAIGCEPSLLALIDMRIMRLLDALGAHKLPDRQTKPK